MDKIGLHIIGGWSGNLGRPRLVKLVDVSRDYVAQVRGQVGAECLIIVRWVQRDQQLDVNPVMRAQEFMARYQAEMLTMQQAAGPNIAFEGYNEVVDSDAAAYAAFEIERLRLMHAEGLRSVVGNWSVGTPDLNVWATYRPMLQAMRPGDLLGLHEYWTDTADINNRWHCARWTIPEIAAIIGDTKIVITECGRDMVEGRGKAGWRQTCDAGEFLEDLRRYNTLLEQFPNVVGGTVFSTPGPGGTWSDFDPSEVWPYVVRCYSNPQTYPGASVPEKEVSMGPDKAVPYYHSSRGGYVPRWIIVHDTEGPAAAALSWWKSPNNTSKSSAHWLVKASGEIVAVVPEQYSAHHAGGGSWPGIPAGATGGTSNINHVSIGIELEYPAAPASPPWPEAQIEAAARLVREIAQRYDIPRERVLRHSDVDPARKVDPRNLDWEGFLDLVFGVDKDKVDKVDLAQIRKAAWTASGIAYNPEAALARYAREHDLGNPVTAEVDAGEYRLQGFAGGIVYAKIGEWGNCKHVSW